MEAIPFVLKHGHYASLKLLRPLAARYALTPARFDLLYALHLLTRHGRPYQKAIAHQLGLTRSTVCKMIRALEKAGFLISRVHDGDRRHRRVEITRYGRHCFHKLLKLFRRGKIEREVFRAVKTWSPLWIDRRKFLDRILFHVARYARGLGDHSSQYY